MKAHSLAAFASIALAVACTRKLATYDYPTPVDTKAREVELLDVDRFETEAGVVATADFPGARLAGFRESGPDTFAASIPAENQPINQSPWYAFGLQARTPREVTIALTYPAGTGNRYLPKTAPTRQGPWTYVPFDRVDTLGNRAFVRLELGPQLRYLAGQELIATDSIARWLGALTSTPAPVLHTIGRSTLGRPIWALDIGEGPDDPRPTVVLMSRQHPPEVTGFQAFQAFVERVLADDDQARAFRGAHRLLILPAVNPDGIDEGHWRHNAGGVDLNRDWAEYRQPEVRAVQRWLQGRTTEQQVVWGMDFHSTQYDVLYTHDPQRVEYRGADKLAAWVRGLREWAATSYGGASAKPTHTPLGRPLVTGQDTLRVEPDAIGKPTSASWFVQHYGAVGVTYEVADEQDRDYVRAKARRAAEGLMEVLGDGGLE